MDNDFLISVLEDARTFWVARSQELGHMNSSIGYYTEEGKSLREVEKSFGARLRAIQNAIGEAYKNKDKSAEAPRRAERTEKLVALADEFAKTAQQLQYTDSATQVRAVLDQLDEIRWKFSDVAVSGTPAEGASVQNPHSTTFDKGDPGTWNPAA